MPEDNPYNFRAVQLIKESINELNLSLKGRTVLTEVGSGPYLFCPIIAALAGASKVFAWTRDSKYGKGDSIINECFQVLEKLDLVNSVCFSANEKPAEHIAQADIITNSGFLRPLNKDLLEVAKPSVVVPLMYEAWELRESDIDINYCEKKGIRVAGTWENHPSIKVFENVGPLAIKLSMNAGMEVLNNKIIVWSDDEFGENAVHAFTSLGASSVLITTDIEELYSSIEKVDFIFIADYSEERVMIGEHGMFDLNYIKEKNPGISFVHLYGDVSPDWCRKYGLNVYPKKRGFAKVMTETLGYVGLKPIINLQTAGFKVAQEMIEFKLSNLSQPIV